MIHGHGDDLPFDDHSVSLNFSSNVYRQPRLDELFSHLGKCWNRVRSYPEPAPETAERIVAESLRLASENVCLTNGATEAIYLVAQAFSGRRSCILAPTFSEYADACRLHCHKVRFIYSLDRLPADADIVWLCNPNNPTGAVIPHADMEQTVGQHPHTLFVIDQSYEDFTLERLFGAAEAAALPNVILLHSMTKCYAVPGLRLGAVTGSRELLSRIRACRMPWSVNALAVEAGHYLLQHLEEYRMDIQALLAERKRVTDALEALGGVEVLPTDTHYFLARLQQGTAAQLKEFLATRHGLLIRDASNFEGLDARYFRIAIQTEEENNLLIEGIHEWIQNS